MAGWGRRGHILLAISVLTIFNTLLCASLIYARAWYWKAFDIPVLLGVQITAASLLFLLLSVGLGIFGLSKFRDIDRIVREETKTIVGNMAKDEIDRAISDFFGGAPASPTAQGTSTLAPSGNGEEEKEESDGAEVSKTPAAD